MYSTCNYKIIKELTREQLFDFMKQSLIFFNESGYSKRFMLIGRNCVSDIFSTRYIYANFEFSGDWVHFMANIAFTPSWWNDQKFERHQLEDWANSLIEFLEENVYAFISIYEQTKNSSLGVGWTYLYNNMSNDKGLIIKDDEKTCTEEQAKTKSKRKQSNQKDDSEEEPQESELPNKSIPEPKATKEPQTNINIDFGLILQTAIKQQLDNIPWMQELEARFQTEVAKLRPIVIKIEDRPVVKLPGRQHLAFESALKLAQIERQVFLSGPMGTGKTTLAHQVATGLSLPFAHISCTIGMSEAQLLGRMNAQGDFSSTDFIRLYENGGVFLFDEVDAADANTMLVINSALANGYLSIPNRKGNQVAQRHPDFICFCAANTWGFGSNEYAGRNILDAAFLDRFVGSKIYVDYDKDLEAEISRDFPEAAKFIWKVRANVYKSRIKRAVSTRALESAVRSLKYGDSLVDFAKRFFTGWTNEERSKAMDGVKFENKKEHQEEQESLST